MRCEYYLSAITLLNALVVAGVAVRQYQLSKERFKFDLFDKRYGVYKNTQIFLDKICSSMKVEREDIWEFRAGTQDSMFFFNNDIPDYLDIVEEKAVRLWKIRETLKDLADGEERTQLAKEMSEIVAMWFPEQLPLLRNKFEPYLAFKRWK